MIPLAQWRRDVAASIAATENPTYAEFTDEWCITPESSLDWPEAERAILRCYVDRVTLAVRCVDFAEQRCLTFAPKTSSEDERRAVVEQIARLMFSEYLSRIGPWVAQGDHLLREMALGRAILNDSASVTAANARRRLAREWLDDFLSDIRRSVLTSFDGLRGRHPIAADAQAAATRDAERDFLHQEFERRRESRARRGLSTTKAAIRREMAETLKRADGRGWTPDAIAHAMRKPVK